MKKYLATMIIAVVMLSAGASAWPLAAVERPSLRIMPAHVRIFMTPASVSHQTIAVTNNSDNDINVKMYAEPHPQAGARMQIARWIEFEHDLYTIAAQQTVDLNYTIHVPLDVADGDQLAIVYIEKIPDVEVAKQAGTVTTPRVGSVVNATISGDTRDGVTISDLSLPSVFHDSKTNLTASSKVANSGNTDLDTFFHLEIKSVFGSTLYDKESTVIIDAGTEHHVTQEWQEMPMVGIFDAHYSVTAFGKDEELSRLIIAAPMWLVIVVAGMVALGIVVFICCIYRLYRRWASAKRRREN
jgi:hypothetical protein